MDSNNNSVNVNGLPNFGNSCWFNSSFQFIKPIMNKLLGKVQRKPGKYYNIFSHILIEYFSTYTNQSKFKNKYIDICARVQSNGGQEDSCESLYLLLEDFGSVVNNYISIKYKNVIKCTGCKSYQILNDGVAQCETILISKQLVKHDKNNGYNYNNNHFPISFDKFLSSILTREQVINESLIKNFKLNSNSNCNNTSCTNANIQMQTVLTTMPEFLIINTGRTYFANNSYIKSRTRLSIVSKFTITTPLDLDAKYKSNDNTSIDNNYVLCAIIVHLGQGINSGHYICYIRDIKPKSNLDLTSDSTSNSWYLCDDNNINPIANFNLDDKNIQSNCHLLLYIKD